MKNDTGGQVNLTIKMDAEKKDYLRQNFESMSGRGNFIVENWIETEQELGIRDDVEQSQLAVLRAYRNAIAKNIQTMQHQLQKIDSKIEELEEDEGEEILFEVQLDLEPENI